ncbi:M1 family aminopeptidase [Pedobacter alpinus]|uniref:Aminopeptidase N n=1 Tax=Pedobacter alpinus TaxID=1590643 RepID=A0ABW5TNP8_9SPHI
MYNSKFIISSILFILSFSVYAQENQNSKNSMLYRASITKINELVNTKLDVRFDYAKAYLYGKAWLTIKPYFYNTDSLTLDAKGMDIKNVSIVNGNILSPLKFSYDSLQLKIKLGKTYKASENYTVYIAYTAKPNEFKVNGSAAITDAKGLYFINPDSTTKGKPVQIWTQGETEGSSVWFPTIDSPNQKTTQEISITVPSKYVTLSNGALISQKANPNGTRTDTWKMDKPHSPYLFMMAVGDFKIYRDKYKDIPVDYYLEPAYAPHAKDIFGKTPEMMAFFSKKLGIEYPWNKYAQIVVRDFVSGAMENTTATVHGDYVQQTKRELLDGSAGEETIAHEIFHQWFGNYVTAESWSNLSVNESFADLSETLWAEYSGGKDAGDAHNYESMQAYLSTPNANEKKLIRFNYEDKEDMFDVVTYQKGGRILNMLRNYLGEDAFYKSLNLYLKNNAYRNGEAHQLRLAFEQVTGQDLNWFFNQWFYRAGHPELKITYQWNDATKTQTIYLNQTQNEDAFILPMKIDTYVGGKKIIQNYWFTSKSDSIKVNYAAKPDLINVDADKILLVQKTDDKTMEEYAFQYKNSPLYVDRLEAVNAASKKLDSEKSIEILIAALKDPYFDLRIKAIDNLKLDEVEVKAKVLNTIISIAKTDVSTLTKAAAIDALGTLQDSTYLPLFKDAIKSQSYAVQASALNAMGALNIDEATKIAKNLEKDSKGPLVAAIVNVYTVTGSDAEFSFVANAFEQAGAQSKFQLTPGFVGILMNVKQTENLKIGLAKLTNLAKQYKKYGADEFVNSMLANLINSQKNYLDMATEGEKLKIRSQIAETEKTIATINSL